MNWTVGLGGFCVAIGIERFLTSACAVAGPYFIAAAMMVLLVFVKVPNRTVDPDARKSRARVTVNVRRARVTVNVRSCRGIGWSWNLTTGYPELWTSRKPSAKVPCGATRSPSIKFVSVH